jgi:molybdopterin-guanine dinucleotide biosynthesis protein A
VHDAARAREKVVALAQTMAIQLTCKCAGPKVHPFSLLADPHCLLVLDYIAQPRGQREPLVLERQGVSAVPFASLRYGLLGW